MTAKCSICGFDVADKVVLRDDYGQVRMTHPIPFDPRSEIADAMYDFMDRHAGCMCEAECKDCRDALRREAERELAELDGYYD